MTNLVHPIADLSFPDLEQEMAATRRVLERVPEDQLSWKPHERSTSLGDLASHIVDLVAIQAVTLTHDELDYGSPTFHRTFAGNRAELLGAFDRVVVQVREAVAEVEQEDLARDWTFRLGDYVIFTKPKLLAFRSFGLSHIAHHRGQLTVYLRMLDIPLPPVYGPTADEK